MVKTVRPIFRKLLQTVKEPVLILNTSCQIESINDFAAEMLNIDSSTQQVIQLDELSQTRWNNFLLSIKRNLGGFCHLNFQIGENHFKDFHLMGYFHEKKDLIFARISRISEIPPVSLQQSTMEIYSIFNDISHGVILTDLSGKIVDFNDIALNYIGFDRNTVSNKDHDFIFNTFLDYESSKHQYFSELMINGRASINVLVPSENGKTTKYYKLESKLNHKVNLIITTITDETEKMALQQLLEQQQTLNSIGQMAASIAHEIRNPMTSLKGFVELIRLNTNDDNQSYLSVMDSELERMESILSELLYLSKPKERKYEDTSILQVVNEVVELMMPHAMQHNIVLRADKCDYFDFNIQGNSNRLKQMLINLVKNAIEVMPHGGDIVIKLANKNDSIEVSVKDEGSGMSESELDGLFTPFYTTKSAGTGLGLALVKKVIEEHSGSIEVESEIGMGTTFKLLLPISHQQKIQQDDETFIKMWMKKDSLDNLSVV
ncbi:PAS domain-containing protein [Lysinibacillus yapensis]|uniref:histidine kinase n=1 Tax=Ureibacillus yapensis TaxID=2304605 RepID=A0A396SKD7_9BACL|nr:ATP-binding protein [Lysinibacillus yapensis]RHW39829.1 PAS domain-containing protein [Lysinibacillus yapensis]